ncbi:MAG: hypothetical protein JWR85_4053 [Marmoricola sp.]|nr:hypothetical protein [Marmoricola sp.]
MTEVRSRGNRARALVTTAILSAAAMSSLAACGSDGDEGDQIAYCADEDGRVIDEDYCDDDDHDGHGGGFIFIGGFGGHTYHHGDRIPSKYRGSSGGTTRISANDQAARAKVGLPKTGTVKSGTRVAGGIGTGKAGGVGKGSSGKAGGIGKGSSGGG